MTAADTSRSFRDKASVLDPRAAPGDAKAVHRILVCVDESPFSEACLPYAVAISKSLGDTITLLHVMEPLRGQSGLKTCDPLAWEISRQEANIYLERLKQEGTLASGQQVETRLEQGYPAERIVAVARELDVDLTVLGSEGEGGVAAWNLGSTVMQILAVARGSVLIARSSSASSIDVSPKRILIPLDGSTRAESVLATAGRIARTHDAELLLVFVVRELVPSEVLREPEDLEAARQLATRLEVCGKRYLEGLRDRLTREGTSVRALVLRSTDDRQALLELCQKERSDLIVLSAHGSTCNAGSTFGSVTAHFLKHSVVPVLVLQDIRERRGKGSEPPTPLLRASYIDSV
jgi:nucleotide-binding universal stress UspA family protein